MGKILFTIGFTKKSAEEFFGKLKGNNVECLIDTRINTTSQLAGFTKREDLEYFLRLHEIHYDHRSDFAPTKELLKDYHDKKISWTEYEIKYNKLLEERRTYQDFFNDYQNYSRLCLLCSEATPEQCHRRLLAEKLQGFFLENLKIVHL